MRAYEPWHLPPDFALVVVAAMWLVIVATLAVMMARCLGVTLAISERPPTDIGALAALRRGRTTLRIGLALCGLIAPVALLGTLAGYHARLASGVVEQAFVVDKHVSTGRVRERRLRVRSRIGGSATLHAMPALYERARRGDAVSVVVVPGAPWATQLGPRPTVHFALVLFAGLLALVPVANVLVLPFRTASLLAAADDGT